MRNYPTDDGATGDAGFASKPDKLAPNPACWSLLMNKALLALGVGGAIAALSWWWTRTPAIDDFDYAAVFEPSAATATGGAIDVLKLAGRSAADVEVLLGPPTDCESTLYSQRCRYAQSPVEIVFIADRADWFTIRTYGEDLPLAAESLARLGLPVVVAAEVHERESVWRGLAGLQEVRLVGDENGVTYVRIKAITP